MQKPTPIELRPDTVRDLLALAEEYDELTSLRVAGAITPALSERLQQVLADLAGISIFLACQIRIEEAVQLAEQQLGLRSAPVVQLPTLPKPPAVALPGGAA